MFPLIREILLLLSLIYWFKYLFIIFVIYCLSPFIYSIYLFRFIERGNIFINFKICYCKLINLFFKVI